MSFQATSSLSEGDQLLFNKYGKGPTIPLPYNTITDAFQAVASTHPYATAVRECFDSERTMTYGELDARSNVIANYLVQNHGLGPGQRVICVYSRSIEMCAFIFGVLKSGAQYVPIDGAVMVEASLRHVIHDSGASVVLCLSNFKDKVERSMPAGSPAKVVSFDATDAIWTSGDMQRLNVNTQPQDGAYVIYTSGTTGKPKGVDCSHLNLCNTLLNEPGKLGITIGTEVACVLMLSFDLCAWEILGTLMNGGTLNLRGSSRRGGDREIWDACLGRVDVVISTPTGAQKYFPKRSEFPNIKTIVVGGEPCPVSLAEEWSPHVNFYNICGPTEITILNTAQLHEPNTKLTIGKPIPNTNVYVLDDSLEPVRIGEIGLMWVGGLSVSRGYVNLPDLTAQRYRPDRFTNNGSMMFNTGDLGRWTGNGELEPLGRKDDQVKINGFRVELDGVSATMESFPSVEKAAAIKIGELLWGFYSASVIVDEVALKAHLATRLNHYALPSKLVHMTSMPMTPGGKIDKRTLKELGSNVVEVTKPPQDLPTPPPTVYSQEKTVGLYKPETVERGMERGSITEMESVDEKEIELPTKNGIHGGRWIRHKALSAYRKLFIIIFSINLIGFIIMLLKAPSEGLPAADLATAVAANLLASVLFRQEYVVNFVFWLATRCPTSAPLWIRRHLARCYHMGGIHSGAAVTATLWWVIFAVQSTIYFIRGSEKYPINGATVGLTFTILILLNVILVMAYPTIRPKFHDQFEWTHRFAGWTTLALVWAHIVVSTASLTPADVPLGSVLLKSPAIWLVTLTTLSIAMPWMRLRKVPVVVEPLSKHAVRLHFDFCTPPPGRAVRITDNPMREWHAFATVTDPAKKGFSIVVSRAGDWTGRTIENPPTRIWTRGVPASGVLRMAPLFNKIVLVATGSGIGPCLPVIMAKKVPCRIFWSTPAPEKTFGKKIIDAIYETDPEAVIWNTREQGRPNMALEAYKLYRASDAECVCIISNGPVTSKLVYDLESRGVPAFGPIWDS
ncbi:hypothetical protein Daus18300_001672 [Diaporthe australafricana]|uniref:AMP-dependent synthetase/ligase domain-containing protein n=1 Tax=Diaporthe australafricana TaxID=127596 RepID=A0ABR3XV02_9PEZI